MLSLFGFSNKVMLACEMSLVVSHLFYFLKLSMWKEKHVFLEVLVELIGQNLLTWWILETGGFMKMISISFWVIVDNNTFLEACQFNPSQSFLILALLTFGAGWFLVVGAVLCILDVSSTPPHVPCPIPLPRLWQPLPRSCQISFGGQTLLVESCAELCFWLFWIWIMATFVLLTYFICAFSLFIWWICPEVCLFYYSFPRACS